MKELLEFDAFPDNLVLTKDHKALIRDFIRKYEKYSLFHNFEQSESMLDSIIDDIINKYSFKEGLRDEIKKYVHDLHSLSDGISVIMSPDPQLIYQKTPDMVQTIIG